MASSNAPLMRGQEAVVRLYSNGVPTNALDVKSWNVKRNATAINDGVNGENRDRLDTITNYYTLSLTCFNEDPSKLAAQLGYDAAVDSDTIQAIAVGFALTARGGSASLFKLTETVIDDWEWASSGRADRQMFTIPIRGQHFTPV